jgi:hypothetical protein
MQMRKGLVIQAAASVVALLAMLPAPSFSQAQQPPPGQPLPATTQVGVPQGAPQAPAPAQPPAPPAQPTPRWPDGKPMMGASPGQRGLWGSCCGNLAASNKTTPTPFKPWAKMVYEDRAKNQLEPHTRCKPSGGARQFVTPYGTEIVEFRELQQIMVFDIGGPHTFRVIYLDGRPHPKDLQPSYYGHSVGRWEGDTLVVETVGFNERAWIDRAGSPHTEKLRFIERFTRTDSNTLRYEVTVDDPGAYTATWSSAPFTMNWNADRELFEYQCQQSNYAHELMVGTMEKVDRSTLIVP